mmetsp:Transcript_32463/g.48940  ORF Transcript_32463/g.48940 Transcript_32463/m.48940 type:complete len:179 (-) Transcript_32463:236-772(-)
MRYFTLLTIVVSWHFMLCPAFKSSSPISYRLLRRNSLMHNAKTDEDYEKNDDEAYSMAPFTYEIDSNLLPPPIILTKESILFDENAATKASNNFLQLWKDLKESLPFVVTGARSPGTADENPVAAIYNIVFVRLPTIIAGLFYSKNLIEGHDLMLDFGHGPIAISPVLVYATFFLILR